MGGSVARRAPHARSLPPSRPPKRRAPVVPTDGPPPESLPPTVTAVPTALEAHERVGGAADARRSVLAQSVISPQTRRIVDPPRLRVLSPPSVYSTGPNGIEATSNDRIIQRGDLIMLDFGVGYLSMWTDQQRVAYGLKPGETSLPESYQRAFDNAVRVRGVIHRTARPGQTAQVMMDGINAAIALAGMLPLRAFNEPRADSSVEFIIGCHSVGDWGHGIGPSMAFFNPSRLTYAMRPSNCFSIELFAYTPIPEGGGTKLRIPLEDTGTVTTRGVEWVYPVNPRIILVKKWRVRGGEVAVAKSR